MSKIIKGVAKKILEVSKENRCSLRKLPVKQEVQQIVKAKRVIYKDW